MESSSSTALREWKPTLQSLEGRHMIHLYGESETGKSFIIREMMSILQLTIPQIIVFSPTNNQNHTYDKQGEVPSVFIHSEVTTKVLEEMWARQEAMRDAYNKANEPAVIAKLARMTGDPGYIETAAKVSAERDRASKEMCIVLDTLLHRVSKAVIAANSDMLKRANLTDVERYTVEYVAFNPRILLIFDDCTDQLAKDKSGIMQKLFYQGRHNLITTIMACHTDTTFAPALKKQTFLAIFTGPEVASAYFDRQSTGLDKIGKAQAHSAKNAVFRPDLPYQKLVWDRPTKRYHKYTATLVTNIMFCSIEIREYAEKIKKPADEAMRNNAYAAKFA